MVFVIAAGLVLALVIIWRLTSDDWRMPKRASLLISDERMLREVVGVTEKAVDSEDWALLLRERTPVVGDVFFELMTRLGAEGDRVVEELERLGFSPEAFSGREAAETPHLSVIQRGGDLRSALEKALLVGIQIARIDDDYARVGDDTFDPGVVARQAEKAELMLFGEGRRERYTLYGKAALALQDMLQEAEGRRREVIVNLLRAFDNALESLQQEMECSMSKVPDTDSLQWGDGRDRRFYYFKMGVTNTLRRTGLLESLGHLYRLRGVNYDVEEAYRLIAQECSPLVLADEVGIDQLLQMGPIEVQGLVQRTLSGSASDAV